MPTALANGTADLCHACVSAFLEGIEAEKKGRKNDEKRLDARFFSLAKWFFQVVIQTSTSTAS